MNYRTFTRLTDFGPYITRLILELPGEVGVNDVTVNSFVVHVERRDAQTGAVIRSKIIKPGFVFEDGPETRGYRTVTKVYPSTAEGLFCERSNYVTLEMPEEPLGKATEGTVLTSAFVDSVYRITLTHELPGHMTGLQFETCTGDICPEASGWTVVHGTGKENLGYAYYEPRTEAGAKVPLFVWLHGAGEGGPDPRTAFEGNRVTGFTSREGQLKLGGACYVLTPQSPTVWMDDGEETLGKSNRSIYTEPLKRLIDAFVASHEAIDTKRIYIGGLSNGGFMTMRMILDYPDYFAAAVPTCEVFYSENITEEMLNSVKDLPIWFVHCRIDELVPPMETSVPTYLRLKKAGASNVHFSYFDHMEDLTGQYRDENGRPRRLFNHGVWNHVYNDDCYLDMDGTRVLWNGVPVTLLEWLGQQSKN